MTYVSVLVSALCGFLEYQQVGLINTISLVSVIAGHSLASFWCDDEFTFVSALIILLAIFNSNLILVCSTNNALF